MDGSYITIYSHILSARLMGKMGILSEWEVFLIIHGTIQEVP